MKIPKHLGFSKTDERKKQVVAFVKECRKALSNAPAFDTTDEAVEAAVQMVKKEDQSLPSVWKEPQDLGTKHTVVHASLREKAYNAGYTLEISTQKIFDIAFDINRDEVDLEVVD